MTAILGYPSTFVKYINANLILRSIMPLQAGHRDRAPDRGDATEILDPRTSIITCMLYISVL